MHEIIRSLKLKKPSPAFARSGTFRQPHYDCIEQGNALKLVLYVPGVDASGVDIEVRGPDLLVTAPKGHLVRANWKSLHLEAMQRDYRLCLRLGFSLDYAALRAELREGVLTIVIPKKSAVPSAKAAA